MKLFKRKADFIELPVFIATSESAEISAINWESLGIKKPIAEKDSSEIEMAAICPKDICLIINGHDDYAIVILRSGDRLCVDMTKDQVLYVLELSGYKTIAFIKK